MEQEVWRNVIGYEGFYEVSNIGRVKSLARMTATWFGQRKVNERILKSSLNTSGYPTVLLCKNSMRKSMQIHQIVAMSFLSHISTGGKIVIDHINGIRTDNRVENLRVVTQRFNISVGHRIDKSKLSSQFVGVCWDKRRNRWRSTIRIDGKRKHLGLFNTESEASEAYQLKLKSIKNT